MLVTQEKQESRVKYNYQEIINAIHTMHEEHVIIESQLKAKLKQQELYTQQQEYLLQQSEKKQAELKEKYNAIKNQLQEAKVQNERQSKILQDIEIEQARLKEEYNAIKNQLQESKVQNERQSKILHDIEKKQAQFTERNESLQIRLKDSETQREKLHEHLKNLRLNNTKPSNPKSDHSQQPEDQARDLSNIKPEQLNQTNTITETAISNNSNNAENKKTQDLESDMFLTRNPFASGSFWKEKIASWKNGGE